MIQESKLVLSGDEAKLHMFMSEEQSAKITSSLVESVLSSLKKEPEFDVKEKIA